MGQSGQEKEIEIYYCRVLVAYSTFMSSRPVAMANFIVARLHPYLVSMSLGQIELFLPSRKRGCLFLCLFVLALAFSVCPISCLGRESA
jgi:hypothetical protein